MIDYNETFKIICNELAAAKTYIKISKYEHVRDYHKEEAIERELHYLSRITKVFKDHEIYEDFEVLALFKKHKHKWEKYLKIIKEENKDDSEK